MNWLLWVIVSGIAGSFVSSLAGALKILADNKETKRQVHIIPSDETIYRPSEVQIEFERRYR